MVIEAAAAISTPSSGQVIGTDAAAVEVGADGSKPLLDARPPASVEHGRKGYRRGPRAHCTAASVAWADQHRRRPPHGGPLTRFSTGQIRNVALVGHQGSGKTSLAEALLHRSGAINRLGRVEEGSTTCDFDPEEQRRGLSLSLAMAPFEWKGHKVNLIDTPGYADFVGDVAAALRVADLAVFVVERGRRRRGPDRGGLEAGCRARPAADGVHQQARPRARVVRSHARPAARSARRRHRAARAARSARKPPSTASPTC